MQVKCPQCGKLTEYNEGNAYRPFCSDRCKLIDLGEWASGKYVVPTEELPTDSDDNQEENTEDQD